MPSTIVAGVGNGRKVAFLLCNFTALIPRVFFELDLLNIKSIFQRIHWLSLSYHTPTYHNVSKIWPFPYSPSLEHPPGHRSNTQTDAVPSLPTAQWVVAKRHRHRGKYMWLDQWRPKYAKLYVTDLVVTFKTNQVKLQTNPSLVILATPVLLTVYTPPLAVVIVEEIIALSQPTASTAIHLVATPTMPA